MAMECPWMITSEKETIQCPKFIMMTKCETHSINPPYAPFEAILFLAEQRSCMQTHPAQVRIYRARLGDDTRDRSWVSVFMFVIFSASDIQGSYNELVCRCSSLVSEHRLKHCFRRNCVCVRCLSYRSMLPPVSCVQ